MRINKIAFERYIICDFLTDVSFYACAHLSIQSSERTVAACVVFFFSIRLLRHFTAIIWIRNVESHSDRIVNGW